MKKEFDWQIFGSNQRKLNFNFKTKKQNFFSIDYRTFLEKNKKMNQNVHNLADFSIEQIENMCKEFLKARFKNKIKEILLEPDITKYYALNSEYFINIIFFVYVCFLH